MSAFEAQLSQEAILEMTEANAVEERFKKNPCNKANYNFPSPKLRVRLLFLQNSGSVNFQLLQKRRRTDL